jgi:hypothetical protein
MDRKTTIVLVAIMLVLGILLGVLTASLRPGPVYERPAPREPPSDPLVIAKVVISFVNLFLILALLIIYIDIYSSIRSRFALGLIFAILALLVYAITSNPIVHLLFGYPEGGAGPFLFIPDIFTALAAAVLLYLSIE